MLIGLRAFVQSYDVFMAVPFQNCHLIFDGVEVVVLEFALVVAGLYLRHDGVFGDELSGEDFLEDCVPTHVVGLHRRLADQDIHNLVPTINCPHYLVGFLLLCRHVLAFGLFLDHIEMIIRINLT